MGWAMLQTINLTPVAIAEGHAFADSMFGQNIRTISHDNVASAVFSQPPMHQLACRNRRQRKNMARWIFMKASSGQ